MSSVNNDAREFGLHVKQGGWRLGLLVARSVEKGTQGGDRKSIMAQSLHDSAQKVTCTAFAEIAGTSKDRVSRYLDAWNRAAADGVVKAADELTPGEELELDWEELPAWGDYYTSVSGGYNGSPERLGKISAEQVAEIIRANQETAVEIMSAIRMENAERQIQLNAELREASAQDFDDRDVVYHPPAIPQPAPAVVVPQPTAYIHEFSPTAKSLVALSMEADDLVTAMSNDEDGIFYADLSNPENYKILEAAYDSLSLNVTRIGQMLANMREQAIKR